MAYVGHGFVLSGGLPCIWLLEPLKKKKKKKKQNMRSCDACLAFNGRCSYDSDDDGEHDRDETSEEDDTPGERRVVGDERHLVEKQAAYERRQKQSCVSIPKNTASRYNSHG
jgi:hypothetical protein